MEYQRKTGAVLVLSLLCGQLAFAAEPRPFAAEAGMQALRGQDLSDDRTARQSDADERTALTLTVYQGGSALIRDQREVGLVSGRNRLVLTDISPMLLPETLQVTGEGTPRVRAQRYRQALLTRENLLRAHVGRDILLLRDAADGRGEKQAQGRLLSVAGGVPVVSVNGRVELLEAASPWRIAFRDVGESLRAEPGLTLDLNTGMAGRQSLELLYLTGGLDWRTDYVLSMEEDTLDLTAWASIDNGTGIALDQARLRLVAGEPNRGGESSGHRMERAVSLSDAGPASDAQGDYHLYTVQEPVNLAMDEQTQLPLFQADGVPVSREYRVESRATGPLRGEQARAVSVLLRFDNDGPPGRAMPAGVARVYQRDAVGEPLFLGQDRIDGTPEGGEVELRVGTAFDVTALRVQQAYRRLDERSEEQTWRIRLANAGDEAVPVRIIEIFSGDWTILESSAPHERLAGDRAGWTVDVPAEGAAELTYRVEIRR